MASSVHIASNISCLPLGSFREVRGGEQGGVSNTSVAHVQEERYGLEVETLTGKDASWILTTAVIIFTMQTGFGLLESGCISPKNEVSILVKNALDVVFGGITYWAFGFGLSFGTDPGSNPYFGIGCFFVDADRDNMGHVFAVFLFQLSFATTSTTIVSGAMAERTKLSGYILFSLVNTFIYSVPAHWLWAKEGFLHNLGAIDIAGCAPVHLVGGTTGLVATLVLKPRIGAFDLKCKPPLPAPIKALLGLFMLWWGWLRFSSGSIFIMSSQSDWKLAVRAAVTTVTSSMAGGIAGVLISVILHHCCASKTKYDVGTIVYSVLGSLVSITSLCTLCKPWEALLVGLTGAGVATLVDAFLFKLRVDDPVGVVAVHGACGIWGLLCVGLFLEPADSLIRGQGGLLKTGQWYMLGVQSLTCLVVIVWTTVLSLIFLKVIDFSVGLRMSKGQEEAGADITEHGLPRVTSAGTIQHIPDFRTGNSDMMRIKFIEAFKYLLRQNNVEFNENSDGSKLITIKFD